MKLSIMMVAHIPDRVYAGWMTRAVQSILAQSYPNFELIIVDDGSPVWRMDFDDSRIGVFHNDKCRGISYSRNFAVQQATSDFIVVMDADDIAHPDLLMTHVESIYAHPEWAVCGVQADIFHYQTGEVNFMGGWPTKHPAVTTLETFRKNPGGWFLNNPGCRISKKVFDYFQYRDCEGGYTTMEDLMLWLDLLKNGYELHNLPDVLIHYRYKPAPNRTSKEALASRQREINRCIHS